MAKPDERTIDPINPYNFVPLENAPDRSSGYPGIHRIGEERYDGVLECVLTTCGPLITLDQRDPGKHELMDPKGERLRCNACKKKNKVCDPIGVFRFLRDAGGCPIIQGSTLKGAIRSVFEAIANGCMCMAANGRSGAKNCRDDYQYDELGKHAHDQCDRIDGLCPACRLFGKIEGNRFHCRGRVEFSDAVCGDPLVEERVYLKELSSPKPRHGPIYGKYRRRKGPIAGRKFYYHHGKQPKFSVKEHESNCRSFAIEEYAPASCRFRFSVRFENLSRRELGDLLLALELSEGMGHKVGAAKAVGMGKCRIETNIDKSVVRRGAARYESWNEATAKDWYACKSGIEKIPSELEEVLRLNKADEKRPIEYPGWKDYRHCNTKIPESTPMGYSTARRTRRDCLIDRTRSTMSPPPDSPPPPTPPDRTPVWYKGEAADGSLVFADSGGNEYRRREKDFQGKKKTLAPGEWYVMKSKGVFPLGRR